MKPIFMAYLCQLFAVFWTFVQLIWFTVTSLIPGVEQQSGYETLFSWRHLIKSHTLVNPLHGQLPEALCYPDL